MNYSAKDDTQINIIIAQMLNFEFLLKSMNGIFGVYINNGRKLFDPCNNHDDAWLILESLDATLDVDGTCFANKYDIREWCESQVLRSAMIVAIRLNELN